MKAPTFHPRHLAAPAARGFTLVELMVALTGGLFLSAVVFALSRDTTRFYQREARVASATLAGVVGFERLKSDIQRAGYLSTPNVQIDPRVQVRPNSSSPLMIQQLASLRITADTPNLASNAAYAANITAGQTITPDQILLSGSYAVADEFPIFQSDGTDVYLNTESPSLARLGHIGAATATQDAIMANVFSVGRIVRVVDRINRYQFSTVTAVFGSPPRVTLNPPIQVTGNGTGWSINVVNIIRYQIRNLQADGNALWTPLFTASAGAPGEADRTELVREELNAAGNVIAGSTDIVAEYAVVLDLGVAGQLAPNVPTVVRSTPGDTNWNTFFQPAATGDRPQGVRSVRVRLGVRSREADRPANIAGGNAVYRFKLGANDAWARVRTFQADVALNNQAGIQW
jgi:Tfp pilus assembly protein PilW